MNIVIANKIYVYGADHAFKRFLESNYVIDNPEYITRVRLNKWIGNTPKKLHLYKDCGGGDFVIPYGCLQAIYIYLLHCTDMRTVSIESRLNRDADADWEGNDFILRDYQRQAVNAMIIYRFGVLKAPCSSGKTVMGHLLAKATGKRTLWLTHTTALLEQSKKIGQIILGAEDGRIGTVTNGKVKWGDTITYATVQTLVKVDPKEYAKRFDCVIVDECFPADTMISTVSGKKQLSLVNIGDIITTYNTNTGEIEYKPVTHTFKFAAHNVVIVTLSNGKRIVCTSNHPFFTKKGEWKTAENLGGDDYVMQLLPHRIFRGDNPSIQNVQLPKNRKMVLLGGLCKKRTKGKAVDRRTSKKSLGMHEENELGSSGSNCRSYEKQQSDEKQGNKRTCITTSERNRTSSPNKMWKRMRTYSCSTNDDACHGKEVRSICGVSNTDTDVKKVGISNVLQGGHSNSHGNDSNRSGRELSLCFRTSVSRPKKRKPFNWVGVESVQVQKQTSDGTFGGVCADGYVYNIEVDGNNNYFANEILVHNCHRCNTKKASSQMSSVVNAIAAEYKFGLSATPDTLDGYGKTVFCNLGDIKYEIAKDALEESNTIMPVDIIPIETGWKYPKKCIRANGTVNFDIASQYLHCNQERNRMIVSLIKDRPTLVLSNNVDHLCYIINELSDAQVEKACLVVTKHNDAVLQKDIDCKSTTKAREEYFEMLRNGEKDIMFSTYQLAKEGLNIPRLEQVIMAFPAVDDNIITQSVGRVARASDGKTRGICYDLIDKPTYFKKKWAARKRLYKKNGNVIVEKKDETLW